MPRCAKLNKLLAKECYVTNTNTVECASRPTHLSLYPANAATAAAAAAAAGADGPAVALQVRLPGRSGQNSLTHSRVLVGL